MLHKRKFHFIVPNKHTYLQKLYSVPFYKKVISEAQIDEKNIFLPRNSQLY